MTDYIELDGSIREELGGATAKNLRKEGRLPAVIYGENGEDNIYIDISMRDFEKEYQKGNVQLKIFAVKVGKKTYNVIPYQIDIHPVSDRPRHVDFITIDGKKEIKVLVPLEFINKEKCPGLKKNGYLNIIKRKIQLYCNPKNMPKSIVIDAANLQLKQTVRISQVKLPEGTRPVTKKDLILCSITGRGKADTPDAAAAAAAGTTAAPAAEAEKK